MSRFTVLGAGGFIGRALVEHLRTAGHDVQAIGRADMPAFLAGGGPAGHVICCIGLTGDFRSRPLDTADAHVGVVARVLGAVALDSFLYLSTTRVYARAELTRESEPIDVQPKVPGDLYNITKLAGEALCLADPRPGLRVARLSNVYGTGMGTDSFLGQVLAEGGRTGHVMLRQGLLSAKDYIALPEAVAALAGIAEHGQARLYNVARGRNTTHDAVLGVLARTHGWTVAVDAAAPSIRFPRIDITRLSAEFAAPARDVLAELSEIPVPARQEAAC